MYGLIAVGLAIAANIPYMYQIARRKVRPHPFTHFALGVTITTTGVIMMSNGAGAGAWSDFADGALSFVIVVLTLKNYKKQKFALSDVVCLVAALLALAIWLLVGNPLIAVLLLMTSDVFAMIPTIRKTWRKPKSESLAYWSIFILNGVFIVLALSEYTFLTLVGVVAWFVMEIPLVLFILYKKPAKRHVAKKAYHPRRVKRQIA